MSAPLLELSGLGKRYGELAAVDDATFTVAEGARHALIGPNGAGKSTLFKLVSGTARATSGTLRFAGADVTALSEVQRARRGLAQTFQHSSVFLRMSVRENVALAAQRALGRPWNMWRRTTHYRAVDERVEECLDAVGLVTGRDLPARELSHGERQQLEVAIALACRPRLLLLDEPTAGMSAAETARFAELVTGLPDDLTILIIEHDLAMLFSIATTVTVLHLGKVLATGTPEEIRADAAVRAAYLGGAAEEVSA